MIKYIEGNVVSQTFAENTIVPHIVNNDNKMGSGLAWALVRRWPQVKERYHTWYACNNSGSDSPFQLGKVQFVNVTPRVTVANMIAQGEPRGITIDGTYLPPIRLDCLRECMLHVRAFCKQNGMPKVMTGKFGSKRAGASWENDIVPLINVLWSDLDVTIFEYEEK